MIQIDNNDNVQSLQTQTSRSIHFWCLYFAR